MNSAHFDHVRVPAAECPRRGLVLTAGLSVSSIFSILTGLAVLGVVLTLLVPRAHRADDIHPTPVEPTPAAGTPR